MKHSLLCLLLLGAGGSQAGESVVVMEPNHWLVDRGFEQLAQRTKVDGVVWKVLTFDQFRGVADLVLVTRAEHGQGLATLCCGQQWAEGVRPGGYKIRKFEYEKPMIQVEALDVHGMVFALQDLAREWDPVHGMERVQTGVFNPDFRIRGWLVSRLPESIRLPEDRRHSTGTGPMDDWGPFLDAMLKHRFNAVLFSQGSLPDPRDGRGGMDDFARCLTRLGQYQMQVYVGIQRGEVSDYAGIMDLNPLIRSVPWKGDSFQDVEDLVGMVSLDDFIDLQAFSEDSKGQILKKWKNKGARGVVMDPGRTSATQTLTWEWGRILFGNGPSS